MFRAEEVTFGGTGRDRDHARRSDPAALAEALAGGVVLPVWRGQPYFNAGGLSLVPAGDPVLAGAEAPIYLGHHQEQALFAADISRWQPEQGMAELAPGPAPLPHPAGPSDSGFEELRARMADLTPDEAEIAATARALLEWHRSHGFCANCGSRTEAGGGGWNRICPDCGRQHFPRTDPVVIMLVQRGNSLLLGRSPGWIEGMYSCLAGFIEPGETVEAAVRREVAEEAGIQCGKVRYLTSQPWPFPASLMLGCITEALSEEITLDPDELEDALWITREELLAAFAGEHPRVKPPRRGSIAQFLMESWLADRLN